MDKVFSYTKNQPQNTEAWRFGEACSAAANEPKCGDPIDRGLILLRELEAKGYGIVKLVPNDPGKPTAADGGSALTAKLGDPVVDLAELREIAKLAYRALDDAWRVLSTIDGDDTHEQYELGILAKRVQEISVSLFTVLR